MGQKLCTGYQALAYGALDAGVQVVCGSIAKPSSEILEVLNELSRGSVNIQTTHPSKIHQKWSTNDKAAFEVAAGASISGAYALVAMNPAGLSTTAEALMSLADLNLKGALVLVTVDDYGSTLSQAKHDPRQFAAFAKLPFFDVGSPEEAYLMTRKAFALSKRHKTVVIVRATARVCYESAPIDCALLKKNTDAEKNDATESCMVLDHEFSASPFNSVYDTHSSAPSHLGIVAGGISYTYLNEVLNDCKHLGALRIFKLNMPQPFPSKLALSFLNGLREVLVLEEQEPLIERELLQLAGLHGLKLKIQGKLNGYCAITTENSKDAIKQQVDKFCDLDFFDASFDDLFSGRKLAKNDAADLLTTKLPQKPTELCSQCPHHDAFFVLKRALGERKAYFSGDIGCHKLGNTMLPDMVETCLCLSAGFSVPQGMHLVESDAFHLGFMSNSTFFAGGINAVINAVYNQANVTFCVLNNLGIAASDMQPHPNAAAPNPLDFVALDARIAPRIPNILKALGVAHITVADPLDQENACALAKTAIEVEGVSAVVFQQQLC